jgi:RHS repeat-associated protein
MKLLIRMSVLPLAAACLLGTAQVALGFYDPSGSILSQSRTLADADVCRFSSKEFHAASELSYYAYRFYEPGTQRWLNRDPIGEAGGLNVYVYAYNSSPNYFDPDGLSTYYDPNFGDPSFLFSADIWEIEKAFFEGFLENFQEDYGEVDGHPNLGGSPPLPGGEELSNVAKPTLTACKKALRKVWDRVGKLKKAKPGKWNTPQRGDKFKGYRMDRPHPPSEIHPPGSDGTKHHFDWWDYPSGKRKGIGSDSGKVPIE